MRLAIFLTVLVLSQPFEEASANGGQLRIDQEQIGPYVVSVTTNPIPLQVGLIDVSVLVGDPANGNYLRDAEIQVIADSLDNAGVSVSHQATHDQADEDRYQAAEFELPVDGMWHFTVTIVGPDGSGSTSFDADVSPASGTSLMPVILVLVGIPLIIALLWFVFRRRSGTEIDESEREAQST